MVDNNIIVGYDCVEFMDLESSLYLLKLRLQAVKSF